MYLCIGEKNCLWCFVKECEQKKQRENIFTNTLNEQVINDIREYGKEVKEHK